VTASPARVDALIVGLGPAGSATAAHLARQGYHVLAVDRASFPRHKPCSEYLSPEAVRLLDRLGVAAALAREGAALEGTRVFGPGGSVLTGRFAAAPVHPFCDRGLSVARWTLDQRLVEAAREAGADIAERTVVEDLVLEQGGVVGAALRLPGGTSKEVRARLVIGADGLRSVVARRLGFRRTGRPARLAFVTHVAGVSGLDGYAEMHVGRDGYAGLNRIGGGPWNGARSEPIANVALVVPRRRASSEARGQVEEFFFSELERFPGLRGRIPRRGLLRPVQVTGPFAARSRRVVANGALLVGDAAEFFDPFTGDGILSALRGAELAAAAALLALGQPGPVTRARLAPYERARRAAFRGKWLIERMVGFGLLAPGLFDRAVGRLEHHGLAHTFIGVTGAFVPARRVLDPRFLARMVF
jgi:flavin-dependent dehydrogenase